MGENSKAIFWKNLKSQNLFQLPETDAKTKTISHFIF